MIDPRSVACRACGDHALEVDGALGAMELDGVAVDTSECGCGPYGSLVVVEDDATAVAWFSPLRADLILECECDDRDLFCCAHCRANGLR